MTENDWWNAFCQTGRVADYLRYRGVEVFDAHRAGEEKLAHAADNRRADFPREQQHR